MKSISHITLLDVSSGACLLSVKYAASVIYIAAETTVQPLVQSIDTIQSAAGSDSEDVHQQKYSHHNHGYSSSIYQTHITSQFMI